LTAPLEIVPGLWRITLPLPFDLRQVHVHVLALGDGGWMLIDTGLANEENRAALRAGLETAGIPLANIRTILLTHTHPDHVGNAAELKQLTGARLMLHADEQDLLARIEADTPGAMVDELLEAAGAPAEQAAATREAFVALRRSFRALPADALLHGGETLETALGEGRLWHTPGHATGHLCLHLPAANVLIAGDHVLPVITPIISWQAEGDNLAAYLDSLDKIHHLDGALTLPSHGDRIGRLRERCGEIAAHHERRCARIAEALEPVGERTAHELVPSIWVRPLSAFNYRFALDEVLAHLEYLRRRGVVEGRWAQGALRWRRAGSF